MDTVFISTHLLYLHGELFKNSLFNLLLLNQIHITVYLG